MTLQVGKTYERKDGSLVTIEKTDDSIDWPFMDTEGKWFNANGESIDGDSAISREAFGGDASEMILPADPEARKGIPITTGVLDYFPLALAEVAKVSKAGNDQHNPGQPLHWNKTKSLDHADCIPRHLIDRGARDTDGMKHSAKLAWRALALLQTELENEAKQ